MYLMTLKDSKTEV